MLTLSNTGSKPEAFITVHKSRRKLYNQDKESIVYLNDGEKFEIELYNPTSEEVAAQIHINGKNIHESGFILKPNERVFLERYIDVDKSFIFESLDIKGSEKEMNKLQKLLKDTGTVKVTFHKKIEEKDWFDRYRIIEHRYYHSYPYRRYNDWYYGNPVWCCNNDSISYDLNTDNNNFNSQCITINYKNAVNVQAMNNASLQSSTNCKVEKEESITMIGEGEETGQEINNSYSGSKFNIESFYSVSYKLLSSKNKPIESTDIKVYCTSCGLKLKNEFKFCPKCGNAKT